MTPRELDQLLELWALWIVRGCNSRQGFASMLQMMMATRCQHSGAGGAPNDEIETRVEGGVALLATRDELAALVLRVEYGVYTFKDEARTQLDKAVKLRLSLNQYRRKLNKARQFVAKYIENRGKF